MNMAYVAFCFVLSARLKSQNCFSLLSRTKSTRVGQGGVIQVVFTYHIKGRDFKKEEVGGKPLFGIGGGYCLINV